MVAQRYHGVKHLTPLAISEQLNLTLCLSPLDAHIMLVMEGEGRSAKAQKQAAHVHNGATNCASWGEEAKSRYKTVLRISFSFLLLHKNKLPSFLKSIQYTVYEDKQRLWIAT